tara:strand:- start:445 stop:639 length:195 start_codon:yes stop_codon:yes gene_type:complete
MIEILMFFKENIFAILILSLIILTSLVIFSINNNNFSDIGNNDNTLKNIGKVVTIETYNNKFYK